MESLGFLRPMTSKHLRFVNLIKENPIIYTLDDQTKNKEERLKEKEAWDNIHRIIGGISPHRKWNVLRNQYLKIKTLIVTKNVSREVFDEYPETKKYLNGSLSFLDPYLGDFSDLNNLKIPTTKKFDKLLRSVLKTSQVHNFIVKKNNSNKSKHDLDLIDEKYIMQIMLTGVEQGLNSLFSNDKTENMQSDSFILQINDSLEDTLEEVIGDLEGVEKDFIVKICELEVEQSNNMKRDGEEVNNMNTIICNNNESERVTIENRDMSVTDCEIRKFFKELGCAMSHELSIEKQVKLQMKINAFVRSKICSVVIDIKTET
ncbi:unnamed protein product [Chrysodeixis includens]|uniref:MADF domain-containing protein n=1 Tax=Chrysodeixis includens TaxID=689277 RepID=A0A9P0BU99_CHRIL|nr:unnamed protein product [Chrysodeixis includens]